MKILFSTGHFGFLRNFEHGLRELARRGHTIHLLADRGENMSGTRTIDNLVGEFPSSFTWGSAPKATGPWQSLGKALRLTLDYWRYLDPRFADAVALRNRVKAVAPRLAILLPRIPGLGSQAGLALMTRIARACERAVPPGPHVDALLDAQQPDLLVVTPMLYVGSSQVEYVRGAKARGIPTMLCVGSWDHLTTKGLIHEVPDGVTVWNEAQRQEAASLHTIPIERVKATGAQAYDHWFAAKATVTRDAFAARMGLPADKPILLYLCSSPFIAPYEVGFVRRWVEGIRTHANPALRDLSILIRPHPQNAEQWRAVEFPPDARVAIYPKAGANPVDSDARADYYHSMYFSVAVVGINTSALIESGIVSRPVFSIRDAEFARTQEGTLHFQHLKNVNGGLLAVADSLDEHYGQVVEMLADPEARGRAARAFIGGFIRPHGLDAPAAPIYATEVEAVGARGKAAPAPVTAGRRLLRAALYPVAFLTDRVYRLLRQRKTDPEAVRESRRILFVMASPEYLRFYDATLRHLAAQGLQVDIAVNHQKEAKQARMDGFVGAPGLDFVGMVPRRRDAWGDLARAIRGTLDFVRYLDPRMAGTPVLRARMKRKCLPDSLQFLDRISQLSERGAVRAVRMLQALERAVPVSRDVAAFVAAQHPAAVLVTPLVEAASEQVDTVRAARALGIPVGVCVASWDNLTNKGLLKVDLDLVTVWNEHQRTEAITLHGARPEAVTVTGAQPFDRWFEKQPCRGRDEFCAMLGFDPAKPIVLFTGSSFFISGEETEVPFVRRWLAALRSSSFPVLQDANVLVRPHPYNAEQWTRADLSDLGRVAVFPKGRHNPTDEQNRTDFFDSLYHCASVVGVNTSAMIEAAIVGRPVHAVLTPDFAGTQEGTVHFRYLMPENGGFLRIGRTFEDHAAALAETLTDQSVAAQQIAGFVASFIRPCGIDKPAVPILSAAIAALPRQRRAPEKAGAGTWILRACLAGPVSVAAAWRWMVAGLTGRHGRDTFQALSGATRKRLRMTRHRLGKAWSARSRGAAVAAKGAARSARQRTQDVRKSGKGLVGRAWNTLSRPDKLRARIAGLVPASIRRALRGRPEA